MRVPLDYFAVRPLDSTGAQRLGLQGYPTVSSINGRIAALQKLAKSGNAAAASALAAGGYTTSQTAAQVAGRTAALLSDAAANNAAALAALDAVYPLAGTSVPAWQAVQPTAAESAMIAADNKGTGKFNASSLTYEQLATNSVPWSVWLAGHNPLNDYSNESNGASYPYSGGIYLAGPGGAMQAQVLGQDASGNYAFVLQDPTKANYWQAVTNSGGVAVLSAPYYVQPGGQWTSFVDALGIVGIAAGAAAASGAFSADAAADAASTPIDAAPSDVAPLDSAPVAPQPAAPAPLDSAPLAPEPAAPTPLDAPTETPLSSQLTSPYGPNGITPDLSDPTVGVQQYVPPQVQDADIAPASGAGSALQTAGQVASAGSSGAGLLSKVLGALGIGSAAAATPGAAGAGTPGAAGVMGANGGVLAYDDLPTLTAGGMILAGGLILMLIGSISRSPREKKREHEPSHKPAHAPAHKPAHKAQPARKTPSPAGQAQMQSTRAAPLAATPAKAKGKNK